MRSIRILGVRVDDISLASLHERLLLWLASDASALIVTVNPEFVVQAHADKSFADILESAEVATADGAGIVFAAAAYASEYVREPIARTTGGQIVELLAELCAEQERVLLFVGALPEVAQKAANVLRARFPKLKVVMIDPGVVHAELDERVLEQIRFHAPSAVGVALGAGKQERVARQILTSVPTARVAVGVGGVLDYLADFVPVPPAWVRKYGIEWAWRLWTQPHRLRRIFIAAVVFPLRVVSQRISIGNFLQSTKRVMKLLVSMRWV